MSGENLRDLIRTAKRLRKVKRMSAAQVSRLAGLGGESHVRKIEDEDSNPTLDTVQKYLEALGLKVNVEGGAKNTMHTICFFNHAGGSSKTSTCREVGVDLASRGYRVLLIDADPQFNLTWWLGHRGTVELEQTIFPVVMTDSEDLPEPIHVHGVDLIPSSLDLARFEALHGPLISWQTSLQEAIRKLDYDFVLVDAPASLGALATVAACSADHIIVPLPTVEKGLTGLNTVQEMVKTYRRANRSIRVGGYIITNHDSRVSLQQQYLELYHEQLGDDRIFGKITSRPSIYTDATTRGIPVMKMGRARQAAIKEIQMVTDRLLQYFNMDLGVVEHV